MILYFTGTGNSRYIAKRMKEKISDDMICINDRIKRNQRSQLLTTLVSLLVAYFQSNIYFWNATAFFASLSNSASDAPRLMSRQI